jgi:hypothetical protein
MYPKLYPRASQRLGWYMSDGSISCGAIKGVARLLSILHTMASTC